MTYNEIFKDHERRDFREVRKDYGFWASWGWWDVGFAAAIIVIATLISLFMAWYLRPAPAEAAVIEYKYIALTSFCDEALASHQEMDQPPSPALEAACITK